VPVEGYGDTPEQIAEVIIAEWLASGAGDPDFSALWFATPKLYTTPQKWKLIPPPATFGEARHMVQGWTVAEWQNWLTGILGSHPVGFWLIVSEGRTYFRLLGENLTEFAHLAVLALLRSGATPLARIPSPPAGWTVVTHYGDTPENIADAVVAEWIASGCGDPDDSAVWFGKATTGTPRKAVP
jgi:hypothetical protein